jgi:predicted phosphodiesterase
MLHRSLTHVQDAYTVRIAVVSDIHANVQAMQVALRIAEQAGVEAIYCLGDIVGYNADPGPCVDLVRTHCSLVVQGNHDRAVATGEGVEALPADAQQAVRRHRAMLSDDQVAFLRDLPLVETAGPCTLVHASPDAPGAWKHLSAYHDIRGQFEHFDTPFCFTGHTHIPAVIADALGVFEVREGHRYLINVGSVGQPRDHTTKGSLVLFDTEARIHRCVRFAYDVEAAASRIQEEELPARLARRLREGT